jgi:hypothetical protein
MSSLTSNTQENNDDDDSIFDYEITIPQTTATITITKEEIVEDIEDKLGRKLTDDEKNEAWIHFRNSDDFRDIFCEILREEGIPCQGASGLSYNEYFKEDVEKSIQNTIDENFRHYWEGFFENSLETIANEIKDKKADEDKIEDITWDNIESHTQKRIQDENVKNGLARCAKELKETSIKKWKEYYVNTHIIDSNVVLPNGKNKEELVKNIMSYLL